MARATDQRDVPQVDDAVEPGGGQLVSVRRERQGVDRVRVAGQRQERRSIVGAARRSLKQADLARLPGFSARHREPPAERIECERRDAASNGLRFEQAPTLRIEQVHLASDSGREESALRVERDGGNGRRRRCGYAGKSRAASDRHRVIESSHKVRRELL